MVGRLTRILLTIYGEFGDSDFELLSDGSGAISDASKRRMIDFFSSGEGIRDVGT